MSLREKEERCVEWRRVEGFRKVLYLPSLVLSARIHALDVQKDCTGEG